MAQKTTELVHGRRARYADEEVSELGCRVFAVQPLCDLGFPRPQIQRDEPQVRLHGCFVQFCFHACLLSGDMGSREVGSSCAAAPLGVAPRGDLVETFAIPPPISLEESACSSSTSTARSTRSATTSILRRRSCGCSAIRSVSSARSTAAASGNAAPALWI